MASITTLLSGAYRVQIRRKGRYASEMARSRDDAHIWARQAETRVDQGLAPTSTSVSRLTTFGDVINLYLVDMYEIGKPPRREPRPPRSRRSSMIGYGKTRADQGAGPVTLGNDIGVIKMIITHAAAVNGLDISPDGFGGRERERERSFRPPVAEVLR